MNNENKKIVAIYTRVSTIDQAQEGHSLEEQESRLKKFCEANDYQIYKIYTDAGISAKDTNRPAYQKMMKDMKAQKFNLILAFKMDRLSRSIVDFEEFFNEIKNHNCSVEFLCEKIDTTGAAGMMFARILGIFAQFERELIKERTIIGVESAVNKGHYGGKPPLGYMKEENSKLWTINKDEAKIVKEIFNMCLNGKTYTQISTVMKRKYPSIIAHYKTNKKTKERETVYRNWKDSSISVILNNKSYIGIYEQRKRLKDKETIEKRGFVPPIISEEVFNECQESIKRNGRNYYRSKNYLFMQKLICPKCGRILACNGARKPSQKEYLYYKCKDCNVYIREEWIEDILVQKLTDMLELYLAIEGTYFPIDSNLAEDFNNCRIDNKIRFVLDSKIINEKENFITNYELLSSMWETATYETKCKFITEYIDSIKVTKRISRYSKKPSLNLLEFVIKPNMVRKLFELKDKNMTDTIVEYNSYKCSHSKYKSEMDALNYIDILKKKYSFNVIDLDIDKDYYINDNLLFKVIDIKPTRAIEKPKTMFLELCDNCQ